MASGSKGYDSSVKLPAGLTIPALRKSVDYIERELAELIEIYLERRNVFSTLVGIYRRPDIRLLRSKPVHVDDR